MFAIIGIIVAVAVTLLLLVGVLHVGSSGMQNGKASNAAAELAEMEVGVQNLYSAQASFAGLTDTVALDAGTAVVPSNMNDGAGGIVNEWGGAVTLAPAATSTEWTLTETQVPQGACATLATKASDALAITVNGTAITTNPIDIAAITASCDQSDNELVFTFGH